MSQNIEQIFVANPITTNASTDLMYFGQSPYGAGNDAAMTFVNFNAQIVANGTANQIGYYATSGNKISGLTSANNGVLITSNTGVPSLLANSGTPGFVLTANSGAPPSWQAVSASGAITTIDGDSGSATPSAGVITFTGGATGLTFAGSGSSMTLGGTAAIAHGGTGVTSVTIAPTASAFAGWDANSNFSMNNLLPGYTTTATAGGSTTLTIASTYYQFWTGVTTQTVLLPHTSTVVGTSYYFVNNSTGNVTVEASGGQSVQVMAGGSSALFTCISAAGTTAASWNVQYFVDSDVSEAVLLSPSGNQVITSGQLQIANGTLLLGTATGTRGGAVCYSPTTAKGSFYIEGSDNAGNFAIGLTNASFGQATLISLPDPASATANFILDTSATGKSLNYQLTMPSIAFSSTSGIIGTTTNDSAAAGSAGQLISSVIAIGSAISISSGVSSDITSISLTAGDWDVWGNVGFIGGATTNVSFTLGWINTVSATPPDASLYCGINYGATGLVIFGNGVQTGFTVPSYRLSLSGTTTVYLTADASFSISTCTAFGGIYARRRR